MALANKRIDQLDKSFQVLARSHQTIWNNQKELTKSQNLLDEQFAVSTRMSVIGINLLFKKVEAEECIDAKDIEALFLQWSQFRARSDFRDYMMEWMLGEDLSKLPPAPEPEEEKGAADVKSDTGNEGPGEGITEDSPAGQENDVPEVQSEDRATG